MLFVYALGKKVIWYAIRIASLLFAAIAFVAVLQTAIASFETFPLAPVFNIAIASVASAPHIYAGWRYTEYNLNTLGMIGFSIATIPFATTCFLLTMMRSQLIFLVIFLAGVQFTVIDGSSKYIYHFNQSRGVT